MPAVESANKLPLETYIDSFLPSCRHATVSNGAKAIQNCQLGVESSSTLTPKDLQECFDLIESTSKADYIASGTGWHPKKKQKEMRLPDLRYLLVREDAIGVPVAFVSFMMTYEDGYEVVYIYEIHIASHLRGQGLGRKLMDLVEEAGRRAGMAKAMLTVFVSNLGANAFYKGRAYMVDEYSPEPKRLRSGIVKEPDYNILSKKL
jgi:N-alpha-acetyltransferase 40